MTAEQMEQINAALREREELRAALADRTRELEEEKAKRRAAEIARDDLRAWTEGWSEVEESGLRGRLAAAESRTAELVAAFDAERAAAKAAARVRVEQYRKWPHLPKRMPRNAMLVTDLSHEEQARIAAACEREMAPIREAEASHTTARARLAAALEEARRV